MNNKTVPTPEALNVRLTKAMADNLVMIKAAVGPRTRFGPMLSEYRAVEAWRRLRRGETSGFTALYEVDKLGLSFEALVIENPIYYKLFTAEELAEMRQALAEHDYSPRQPGN